LKYIKRKTSPIACDVFIPYRLINIINCKFNNH
jgi:hypothetical protein